MLGLVALCWALWLNRNDTVFDKKNSNSPLQVIYRGIYWIRQIVPVIRGRENGAEEWMQAFGGYVVTGFWKSELEATKKF